MMCKNYSTLNRQEETVRYSSSVLGYSDVKVLQVTHLRSSGNLKAFATVKAGAWTIRGMRVIQQNGQRAYVQFPKSESRGRYFPVVQCDNKELTDAIKRVVLSAYWGGQK